MLIFPKYFLTHSPGAHLLGINPSMSVTLFRCISFVWVLSEPLMFSAQCFVCLTEPITHNSSGPERGGGWGVSIEPATPQADSSPLASLFFRGPWCCPRHVDFHITVVLLMIPLLLRRLFTQTPANAGLTVFLYPAALCLAATSRSFSVNF